jgi:hypothetical protein
MAAVGVGAILHPTAQRREAVNWGVIITFAVVIAGGLFIAYGLIRPFTHFDHDHRDVFHPPHLD